MKFGLLAASLILVAGGAVGCGDNGDGGGGGDNKTSTADFCGALQDFQDDFDAAVDPTKDIKGYIKVLKDAADKLEKVGTPDDMPADAKAGFDLTIKTINDLPDDATLDDLAKIGDVSDADQKKIDALNTYIAKECPDLNGDSSASPTSPSSSSS